MPRHLTLRQRLTRLILGASGLAMLCVLAAAVVFELASFRPRVRGRLEQQATFLSTVLPSTLVFQDAATAQKYLATFKSDKNVETASLYDVRRNLFADYRRADAAPMLPAPAPEGEVQFGASQAALWQPVLGQDGQLVGHLYLQQRLPPVYARVPVADFLTVAVVAMALGIVFAVLLGGLRRYFLAPVSALLKTASKVTTDADYSVRARVWSDDELGHLAVAFNQMLEAIGQRDEALIEANAQIRNVFSAATEVAIIASQTDGLVTLFNNGAERMLGYSAAEIVGRHQPELWHVAVELAACRQELLREFGCDVQGFDILVERARREQYDAREWTFVRKDGSQIKVQLVTTAVRNARQAITGFLGMASDITERVRAQATLQRREEYFRSLIEHASDSITVLNADGNITYQSSAGGRMLGCPVESLLGRNLFDLVHSEDQTKGRAALSQARAQPGEPVELTLRLPHQSGTWRTMASVGTFVQRPDGEVECILNSRDITDNLKLEEQFRQAQKMEAVGRLSGGVAHDFNNILTVIQGNVNLLESYVQLAPDERDSLDEIKEGVSRAVALTRQLLAFSRRQTMQMCDLDLNSAVTNMARMLKRIVGEDVEMVYHYAPEQLLLRADTGMMEQILLNLVVNARDAMPNGGQLVIETAARDFDAVSITAVPHSRPGEFVLLSVGDSGCGIPAEVLPRIFEPFFTTKDVGKGTGLGLATVYGIVQQHQGWINVYSEVGKGTTFRIYLPRLAQAGAITAAPVLDQTFRRGSETVLLVEDEPSLRTLTRKFLSRLGYQVLEASSGLKAMAVWEQHQHEIGLVLTDLVMPDGVSGHDLARHLRAQNPALPIIFMSGYSAEIAGREIPLAASDGFLSKPFSFIELSQVLRKSLGPDRTA